MPARKTVAKCWEQILSNKRLATSNPQTFYSLALFPRRHVTGMSLGYGRTT